MRTYGIDLDHIRQEGVKRTREERKKEWYRTMSAVARRVRAMSEAEREATLSRISGGAILTCEGHPLTIHNTLFLVIQAGESGRPTPTMVGGYRQWGKVGRHVRAGEKAIGYIQVPLYVKKVKVGEEGDVEGRQELRFRLVPVFDVTQTEEGYRPEEEGEDTIQSAMA